MRFQKHKTHIICCYISSRQFSYSISSIMYFTKRMPSSIYSFFFYEFCISCNNNNIFFARYYYRKESMKLITFNYNFSAGVNYIYYKTSINSKYIFYYWSYISSSIWIESRSFLYSEGKSFVDRYWGYF